MLSKRKAKALFLAVVFCIMFNSEIFAAEATPYWTAMIQPTQSFDIVGGKASIDAETLADTNATSVYVGASLQQYKSGSWVVVTSWSNTKIGSYVNLSQTWYVTSGYTYRLVTTHTTYFSGTSESTTLTSRNVTY